METRISYIKKNYCSGGIVSFVLSLIGLVFLGSGIWMSYKVAGQASELAAAFGVCAVLTVLVGTGYGVRGFFEAEKNYLFSKIGTVINLLLLVGIVVSVIVGGR